MSGPVKWHLCGNVCMLLIVVADVGYANIELASRASRQGLNNSFLGKLSRSR
jgi:hypothetical protein